MRQAIRQPLVMTHVITLGFATALLSLLQPLPTVSAQQLTGTVIQTTDGMGTQGQHIENIPPSLLHPTKSLEKKDTQTLTNKPHRLIRKPQNAPVDHRTFSIRHLTCYLRANDPSAATNRQPNFSIHGAVIVQ